MNVSMSAIRTHILLHIFLAMGIAFIATIFGGHLWGMGALLIYVISWLIYHLYHLVRLEQYLLQPSTFIHTQDDYTLWGQLFHDLARQYRKIDKHRDLLRLSLKRFQAAAHALPNGIIVINSDGKIDWLNQIALEHFQLSPQNALGSPIKKQLWQPECQALLQQPLQANLVETQLTVPQSNGKMRFLRVIRIVLAPQSQLIISEDISRAEQLNNTRTAFVANVSHELRTPLTVINGFLETLADYPDLAHEQRQQFIQLMQNESNRMLNLISDLLTLSALEDPDQQQAQLAPLNLSELCRQIVQEAKHLSGERHTITLNTPTNIWINAHYRDLYQALSNLVFNAVRYTPIGGQIDVVLTLQDNPNPYKLPLVRFAVKDNGVGIAAEHLPHLTDRFYRVDKGRSRDNGGTGLGLAIAKHALANHDAVLEIQSEVGKGSEFATLFQTLPENVNKLFRQPKR